MPVASSRPSAERRRGIRAVAAVGRAARGRGEDGAAEAFRPHLRRASDAMDVFGLSSPTAGAAPATLAGIVAQSVFHARFGSRPEESTVHATRAYLRTCDLTFDDAPVTSQVA